MFALPSSEAVRLERVFPELLFRARAFNGVEFFFRAEAGVVVAASLLFSAGACGESGWELGDASSGLMAISGARLCRSCST